MHQENGLPYLLPSYTFTLLDTLGKNGKNKNKWRLAIMPRGRQGIQKKTKKYQVYTIYYTSFPRVAPRSGYFHNLRSNGEFQCNALWTSYSFMALGSIAELAELPPCRWTAHILNEKKKTQDNVNNEISAILSIICD